MPDRKRYQVVIHSDEEHKNTKKIISKEIGHKYSCKYHMFHPDRDK